MESDMGVRIGAEGCPVEMNLEYPAFDLLKVAIARHIGALGNESLMMIYRDELPDTYAETLDRLVTRKEIHPATKQFLLSPSCGGFLMPSGCRALMDDMTGLEDNAGSGLRTILDYCAKSRMRMVWR